MDLMLLLTVLMAGPWIPHRQEDFADFCRVWKEGLEDTAAGTLFGWDRAAVLTVLATINGFLEAWEAYRAVDSSYNRTKKNELLEAAKHDMEMFADTFIRFNVKMSEADKNRFGIYSRQPGHRIEVPTTVPVLMPRVVNPREVVIDYMDRDSEKRGKPAGVHAIEIRWDILDHAPSGVEELANSVIDTRSPHRLRFTEKERGQKLYMAGCWVIAREGEKGLYGEIVEIVIG
jgi:hypothetical protein